MAEKPSLDTNRLITFSDLVEKPRGEKFETGNLLKLVEFVQVSEGGNIEPFLADLGGNIYQACWTKYRLRIGDFKMLDLKKTEEYLRNYLEEINPYQKYFPKEKDSSSFLTKKEMVDNQS